MTADPLSLPSDTEVARSFEGYSYDDRKALRNAVMRTEQNKERPGATKNVVSQEFYELFIVFVVLGLAGGLFALYVFLKGKFYVELAAKNMEEIDGNITHSEQVKDLIYKNKGDRSGQAGVAGVQGNFPDRFVFKQLEIRRGKRGKVVGNFNAMKDAIVSAGNNSEVDGKIDMASLQQKMRANVALTDRYMPSNRVILYEQYDDAMGLADFNQCKPQKEFLGRCGDDIHMLTHHELKIVDRGEASGTNNPLLTQDFTSETVIVIAIYEITVKAKNRVVNNDK